MELKTNPIAYDSEVPVNYTKGVDRTENVISKLKSKCFYGESWVANWGPNESYLVHISTNSVGVDLYTPLRAFGISDELNFVVNIPTCKLYIPAKTLSIISEMSSKFPEDVVRDRMSGLFEYFLGIIDTALHFNVFDTPYSVESITDAEVFKDVKCVKLKNVVENIPYRLEAHDTYISVDDPERILIYARGPKGLVALGKNVEFGSVTAYTSISTLLNAQIVSGVLSDVIVLTAGLKDKFLTEETLIWFVTKALERTAVIKPLGTVTMQGVAFDRFCEEYNFHVKGALTDKDLKITSIRSEYDDDPIAQELYKTVPAFYKDVDLKPYKHLLAGIAKGAVRTAMFFGESGTGKSTIARAMFNAIGIPYAVLNCSVNIEESDIVGTMIPNPKKASTDDPEFVWKDGILTTAVRYGYGIVIEEINFARPGVLGLLNSLLDDAHTLYLSNGESVIAHPNFRLIATGNLGYEGTNRLNAALVNRFNIIHTFDVLNESNTLKIVKTRTGFTDEEPLKKLYNAIVVLRKYIKDQNLSGTVSLRQLLNLVQCGKYYKKMDEAFVDIVLQGALLEYPEYFDEFKSSILKSLKLDFRLETEED